jgi:hypothetical protein
MYVHCAEDIWYVIGLIHFIVIISCSKICFHYSHVDSVACHKQSGRKFRLDRKGSHKSTWGLWWRRRKQIRSLWEMIQELHWNYTEHLNQKRETAVVQWLSYCAKNRKLAGSIPDGVIEIFHLHNPSDRTMALGSNPPLTEMSTRGISWG